MKIRTFIKALIVCIFFSCHHRHVENFEDLQKIETGMTLKEVLSKMRNEPIHAEEAYWDKGLFVYSFASPPAASDHYKVIFREKDSTVVEILYGD